MDDLHRLAAEGNFEQVTIVFPILEKAFINKRLLKVVGEHPWREQTSFHDLFLGKVEETHTSAICGVSPQIHSVILEPLQQSHDGVQSDEDVVTLGEYEAVVRTWSIF